MTLNHVYDIIKAVKSILQEVFFIMIKLVIFDLDGTLLNSIEDIADALNASLEEMGYPVHKLSEFNHLVGDGVFQLCERALPDGEKHHAAELQSKFSQHYRKNATHKTAPYDGIKEVLEELGKRNIKLAVASNKVHEFSVEMVKNYFGDIFDIILGNAAERPKKPQPVIIYDILEYTGIDKSEAVMTGDSDVDIFTARNAGIKSIGCEWGYRGRKELQEAGADYIASVPADILKYIEIM